MATSKTTTDTETTFPFTEASLTTLWATSSSHEPRSSAPAHSESHKAISPIVITSTVETTNNLLDTSLESGTSSFSSWKNSTYERLTTSEPTTDKEAIHHPSTNTAGTIVWTTSSREKPQSTVLVHSESPGLWEGTQLPFSRPSGTTTPMIITPTTGDTTVSTSTVAFSESKRVQTETNSNLTPGYRETNPSQVTSSNTKTNTVLSHVSTGAETSRTEFTSSSRTAKPSPAHFTSTPNTSTQSSTSPSTSVLGTESTGKTLTNQTDAPWATSQDTLTLDSSTTDSWAGTQSFPHSEMTTLISEDSKVVSRTSLSSVNETSSLFSLVPTLGTSLSSISSTLQEHSPSSSLPVTSVPTSGLVITDMLGTSLETDTSSPPNLGRTSGEALATSEDTTDTEVIHSSTNTVVTTVETTSSGHESQSSVLAHSEPFWVTYPSGTTSTMKDITFSTSIPPFFDPTRIETEPTYLLTSELKDTSTSQGTSLSTEKSSIFSHMSMDTATTELLRTEFPSSESTVIQGPTELTLSLDITPGTSSRPSIFSTISESAPMTFTTQTDPPGDTSLNSFTLHTSTTGSWEGTQLPYSRPSETINPTGTSTTMGDTTISTSTPAFSETNRLETEMIPNQTPGLKNMSTSQMTTTVTETSTVLSHASTSAATTDVSWAEFASSSRTSITSPIHLKSPSTSTQSSTSPSTSLLRTDSAGMPFTTKTGFSRATSQSTFTLDTSTAASWTVSPSVVTQDFPHSRMTTLMSTSSEDVSRTSPPSVEESSSSPSLSSLPATTSPSSVLSTLQEYSHSSPLPVTTDMLVTSFKSGTSSLPNLSSTSGEIPATSETNTVREEIRPSSNTVLTDMGTTSSRLESNSVLAQSEPLRVTSPGVITSTMGDITSFTSKPTSSETRIMETEQSSSLTTGMKETSILQETSSATETYTVLSQMSTGAATTELSKTEIPFSDRTLIPGSTQSMWSPEIFSGTSSRPSISPLMTGSAHKTLTIQTIPPEPTTSLDPLTLDTQSTISFEGTQFVSSRLSEASSPLVISTDSTLTPVFYEITRIESESTSSLTPGFTEYITSQMTDLATDISLLASQVSIGAATTEVSKIEVTSSDRISNPGPNQSKGPTDITTKSHTTPSTSPLMTNSIEMTFTTHTGAPGPTSQGSLTSNTSTTALLSETPLVLTQRLNPSSPLPVTSIFTSGSVKTTANLETNLEAGTNSSPNMSNTSREVLASSEATIDTEAIHHSTNTIVTTVGTTILTSSPVKTTDMLSTSLAPSTRLPPNISSTTGDILTPSEDTNGMEIIHPSTNTVVTTVGTISSGHIQHSTVMTPTAPSRVTSSVGSTSVIGETNVSTSLATYSEITEIKAQSTSPLTHGLRENRTSLDSSLVTDKSTVVFSVSTGGSPSSPLPETSVLTSGPVKTTANLGSNLELGSSSPPNMRSTSGDILATSEATTGTKEIHPFTNTAGATVGTTSSEHVLLSFVPAHSEPHRVTSPMVATSGMVEFTVSTPTTASSETTKTETKSSSLTTGMKEISTFQGANSTTEAYTVLPHVSMGAATTELSKTEIPSSDRTFIPGSTQSTGSPEISPETSSTPSTSFIKTESAAHMIFTTQSVSAKSTSLDALNLDTLPTVSLEGTRFASSSPPGATSPLVTTSIMGDTTVSALMTVFSETRKIESELTSSLTTGLRKSSTTQPPYSATGTNSVLSHLSISSATAEISRREVTSSNRISHQGLHQSEEDTPSSPLPETSALTSGPVKTTANLESSLGPGSSSPPNMNSTSDDRLNTSEATTDTEATNPSTNTAVATVGTTTILSTSLKPGTSSLSSLSNTSVEIKSTSETTMDTQAIRFSTNTTTTAMTISSRNESGSSVPVHSEPTRTTYSMVAPFTVGDTTISMSMPASLETTSFETAPLSHLTPGLRDTSMSLDRGSVIPTHTPAPPVTTHLLKDHTSSVTISVLDQSPSSQLPGIPVETITNLHASPSITSSAGVTSLLESNLTVPVPESTNHQSTDMLPSADTIPADTLIPSLPEVMTSFGTTGVPGTSVAALSTNPLFRTQSSPGVDTLSTIAENLPSLASTQFPSSTFTTTDSSTSPTFHGMTSSPATTNTVDTSLGAESSSAEGPLMMASTLETWTQTFRTSLSPVVDARITESVDLGTVTRGSLTRTDSIVKPITKIPDEAAHGGIIGPMSGSLTSTSPVSPRELSTRGTERAETTTTALKATGGMVSLTSTTSTPTLGTLTALRTSGNTPSSSTTGLITSPAVSPDAETTALLATTPDAEISPAVPRTTPSVFKGEPETTTSLVPSSAGKTSPTPDSLTDSPHDMQRLVTSLVTSSWAETRMSISTLTDSPDESVTTASSVTYPSETSPNIPRTTPNVSSIEADSTPSMAISPGEEASSAVPTRTVSPGALDMVTSLFTRSGAETSTVAPTMTDFLHEPETTAHPKPEVSSAAPILTISSDLPEMVTSLVTSSGEESSPSLITLTDPSHVPKTTTSWVTHPSETSSTVPRTTPSVSYSESDTTPSMATNPQAQASSAVPILTVSPGVLDMVSSLVTGSGAETSTIIPGMTDFPGQSVTTVSLTIHPETQTTSAVSTPTVSSSEQWVVTSLVTNSGTETSTAIPTLTDSPDEPDTTASWVTSPQAEASTAIPTLPVSPGVLDMVTSLVTSSEAETSTTIPGMTDASGQLVTTASLVTHPRTETSSSFPTLTVSPDLSGIMTSLGTSSGLQTSTTIPTLTVSSGEPETTSSLASHPGTESSSAIPNRIVSTGVTEMVTSLFSSSGADTSTTIPAPTVSLAEPETTSSLDSHPGTESRSAIPTLIVSTGVTEKMTSLLVSTSGIETSTTVPVLTVPPDEPETTALPVTHPASESSSAIPTLNASSGVPGVVTSLVTSSGVETSTTISSLIVSSGEPEATSSLTSHPGTESSSVIPTLIVSTGIMGMGTSLVTSSGAETSIAMQTQNLTNSPGQPETTASLVTHPETEISSSVPTLTISPGLSGMMTSLDTSSRLESSTTIPTLTVSPHEPQATSLPITHPGTQSSSAIPTLTVSTGVMGMMTSLTTGSGAEISTTVPTLTVSPGELKITVLPVTHPGAESSSAIPTQTVSPGVPGLGTLLVTSSGAQSSTTIPTLTDSETSPLPVNHPKAETSSSVPTPTSSPGLSEMVTSLVTSSQAEASTTIPTLTVSPSEPETTTSLASHPRTESKMVTSLVSSPAVETTTSFPELTVSPGAKFSSAVPALTVSPGVSGVVTSLVTSSGAQTSTGIPTMTDSLHETETSSLPVTHLRAEASSSIPILAVSPSGPGMVTSLVTSSEAESSTTNPMPTASPSEPETSAFLVTHPSAESNPAIPASTVLPYVSETTGSLVVTPGVEMSTALPVQTISLGVAETTSSLFTIPRTETSRYNLTPTVSPKFPTETASLATLPGTETSTTIATSTLSPGLSETTGLLVTSPAEEASTGVLALTVSPGVPGRATAPAVAGEPNTVVSWSTETSAPMTSVGLPEFSRTVTGATVTLMPSETPTPPKTGHGEGASPTTTLKTASVEITDSATTGPGAAVAETITTFSTLSRSPSASWTTPEMSTWASSGLFLSSPTAAAVPFLIPFTVNFTVTNLRYVEDMGHPESETFNTTERVLLHLLRPLLKDSSISSLFIGCQLTALRPKEDGAATGVDVVCTHRADPTSSGLDRERLYWELSHKTRSITQLGSYTLDRDSLYINGYTHRGSAPTPSAAVTSTLFSGTSMAPVSYSSSTAVPFLVPFTLNFTITNLRYTEDMQLPGSGKFNFTEKILQRLLQPLFKNSSLGFLYAGCSLDSLRSEKDGAATRVDAICTHHPDPKGTGLDREWLYWELSKMTHSVNQLGPYTLARDSLYVNGFTHRESAPITNTPGTSTVDLGTSQSPSSLPSTTATSSTLGLFTLNFTITNLRYTEDMGHPRSVKFNTTEKVLQRMLGPLFKNSSVSTRYSSCRVTSFRPKKDGTATRVDAICTYHSGPTSTELDRERLYWELSHGTHGVTRLGFYTLDRDSLFVNGYTHQVLTSTLSAVVVSTISPSTSAALVPIPTATGPALVPFTLNFTITNLHYKEGMQQPGSLKYNTTEIVLQRLLGPLFKNTSIGSLYSGCRLTSLRPKKDGTATRVDVICTHHPDPEGRRLDREQLYWELSKLTHGATRLDPYTLDKGSLYVNGYTHQTLATTPSIPGPALMPFTLNFTITNLRYMKDMRPGSAKFNSTESVLQRLLKPLFTNSSIGFLYTGCRLTTLRPEKDGGATGVDAVCTYHPDPTGLGLNREQLYWDLSHQTHDITQLGPYTLDKDSLYVNVAVTVTFSSGTSAAPSSSSTAPGPVLVPFTLNFTITNLQYMEDMSLPGSLKFNTTERVLQRLLKPLFENTTVGPLYSGCRLTSLRPEKHEAATSIDAICTYRPNHTGLGMDREHLYQELSQLTHGITQLGPYTLDHNSLYINGYTHQTSETTPSAVALVPFTLNFTITNLHYTEDMGPPGSVNFNTSEKVLQYLLGPLFKNTSIGPLFSGCKLTSLRPEKNGAATRADTICTYHADPKFPGLDREQLYWELNQLTHRVTQMGPYTLDRDSLYVNAPKPALVPFTLNFTITNLHYMDDMGHLGSVKFNFTEKILQHLLGPLLNKTSVGPLYSGCTLTSLRPKKDGKATRVNIICTHRPDPDGHRLDREWLYWELSQLTRGVTQLGPYTLDRNSLYVNGYTHWTSATTSNTAEPALVPFTLNFTITNLRYTDAMGHPGSVKFNLTERVLQRLLGPLFKKTSVGPLYSGCRLAWLRPEKGRASTGVDAVCTYYSDPEGPQLDREQLYWELNELTHGINRLDYYSLDRHSLYVNGYTYGASASTTTSGEVSKELFTLNFTINNLRYSADMGHPGTHKFNITDTLMRHLLSPLFQTSSLGARYTGCKVTALRSEKNGAWTGVDALCTYQQPPSGPGLHARKVFHELSWQTHGITQLGPYTLDKDSLYLNGYNERGPAEPPTTPELATTILPPSSAPVQPEATTATDHTLKTLTLNFTISNLRYSPDMGNPSSATFNSTERVLQHLLTPLLQNSSLGPFYSACRLISLRPEKNRTATRVDTICSYHPGPVGHSLDRERLYWELSQLTQGITQLGIYTLDRGSLSVNEVKPSVHLPTEKPTSSPSPQHYQLNFTITNLLYSEDIAQPHSTKYQRNKRSIEDALNQLFQNSSIKSYFSDCQVIAFRSVPHSNHTGVDSQCGFFPLTRRLDKIIIYEEFLRLTQNGTQLQNFTLDKNSVLVDGYSPNRHEVLTKNADLPFWAIILICLAGLLGLITCLICCFLVTICVRKKEGDYEVQRRRLGYYLPHLDLRKLQ
ncbi:mucin-16 [Orycteropus afer afer]|uniref:Mucin-16 n=1 Tax=Orycteropus afer afer TaxID=1230840 RepID=A0AC54ZDQ7_ORYAF|nr:mucin-16 [Orycteropus afer afer]